MQSKKYVRPGPANVFKDGWLKVGGESTYNPSGEQQPHTATAQYWLPSNTKRVRYLVISMVHRCAVVIHVSGC